MKIAVPAIFAIRFAFSGDWWLAGALAAIAGFFALGKRIGL